ncbi:hypothetical protein BDV96DRAFT_646778 [Lophiotrema nucula]|uniref:Uncharacterized protein n=1 Tax=Lophiotrema nucula TaxID=690887 RepID=A0A6A5Z923_9PLEO|nr:hypothetical protein BDV96DRAFT_646778 [Lophiotrema nucula]
MAEALATASAVLYYACWPIIKLLQGLAFILSPFWNIAQFILLPFTSLAQAILGILLLPFKIQLLDRVETIYIYLGIAGLIGCLTGGILHLTFNTLSSALNIDSPAGPKARTPGRTAAQYRMERRKKKGTETLDQSSSPSVLRAGPRQRGLLAQTIIEEEDSDF